jgi:hypothetical protein
MEIITLLVPVLYVGALIWAIGGDFLRAQLTKDLEHQPTTLQRAWRTASLPTFCLVGALFLRLVIPIRGLLLSALVLAVAISVWKMFRLSQVRHLGQNGAAVLSGDHDRILPR